MLDFYLPEEICYWIGLSDKGHEGIRCRYSVCFLQFNSNIKMMQDNLSGMQVTKLLATLTGPEPQEKGTPRSRMAGQPRTASTRASPTRPAGPTSAAGPRRPTPCPASHCASTERCNSRYPQQLQVSNHRLKEIYFHPLSTVFQVQVLAAAASRWAWRGARL